VATGMMRKMSVFLQGYKIETFTSLDRYQQMLILIN